MATDQTTHDQIAARLIAVGQRYTPVRRATVEALVAAGRPVTVPVLLAMIHGVPQSSAYRTLAALAEVHVVVKFPGAGGEGRFELAEGLTGHHHHHLVCSSCGEVTDVEPSSRLERALAEAAQAAADLGYVVTGHRFDLLGTCAACS